MSDVMFGANTVVARKRKHSECAHYRQLSDSRYDIHSISSSFFSFSPCHGDRGEVSRGLPATTALSIDGFMQLHDLNLRMLYSTHIEDQFFSQRSPAG